MTPDIAAIEARHFEYDLEDGYPSVCGDGCERDWPCDAAVLLSALTESRSSNEELRKALERIAFTDAPMYWAQDEARAALAARSLLADEPAQALRRAADEVGS